MNENLLYRHIDNLIIHGLISEAEQDNADFEAAMRRMSDEEFEELVFDGANVEQNRCSSMSEINFSMEPTASFMYKSCDGFDDDNSAPIEPLQSSHGSRLSALRSWIAAAIAAAAVILAVLIPTKHSFDNKLCDSALYASSAYMPTSSVEIDDVSAASVTMLKNALPRLEARYETCLIEAGEGTGSADAVRQAGWALTVAYLKLHRRSDAVKVLRQLAEHDSSTPFGRHCMELLKQLD